MHARRTRSLLVTALVLLLGCGSSDSKVQDGGGGGGGGGNNAGTGSNTVAGFVLDGFGQPLPSRKVLIGAASVTTGANGDFSITGVGIPYDVTILLPSPQKVATVYRQLTLTAPKLLDFGTGGQPGRSASLGGNIVGGDALPTPGGELTGVAFGSPDVAWGNYVDATPYAFAVPWPGPATTSGAVHGLQWTVDENGTVSGYHSHGVKTGVSLTSGGQVSNADLLLTAVLTENVSGTISAPAGHEIVQRDVYLTFDDGAYFPVGRDLLDAGTLTVPVPSGIGAKIMLAAGAVTADQGSLSTGLLADVAPGTSDAALVLPAPAVITAPADGATGVDTSTDLVWTPLAGGIHLIALSGAANDPTFFILSGGSQTRIPDLGAQGLGLPSAHPYDVSLVAVGPYATLDAFVQAGLPRYGFGFQTVTDSRFTTR